MGQFTHILLLFAYFHAHVDKDAEYAKGAMCVWLTYPPNLR